MHEERLFAQWLRKRIRDEAYPTKGLTATPGGYHTMRTIEGRLGGLQLTTHTADANSCNFVSMYDLFDYDSY